MKQQIEEKLRALIEERDAILKTMEQIRVQFEQYRERVIELNGSIQSTQEMVQMIGENCGDTKSKTKPRSSSNKK